MHIVFGATCIIVEVGFIVTNVSTKLNQELDFKKGKLMELFYGWIASEEGKYELTIRQSSNYDTLVYSLFMNQVVNDFNIGPNDSISKMKYIFHHLLQKKEQGIF